MISSVFLCIISSEKKASKGKDSRHDTSDEDDGSQQGRQILYFTKPTKYFSIHSSIDLELNSSKLLKLKQVSVLIQYIFIVHVKIFVPLRAATYFIFVHVYGDLTVQYGY